MARLRQKKKAKKAKAEAAAASAEAREALQESAAALRDLAEALLEQIKALGLDEKTQEALEKIKASDAYARTQAKAAELSQELSQWVAESEGVAAGKERAAKTATAAAAGLGSWLATGKRGEALGIAPAKRRGLGWFLALLGVGVGYAIGVLTAPKEGREIREQLMNRGETDQWDGPVVGTDVDQATAAPSGDPQLADKVRTRLGEDPRTAELGALNINVVDGTVVVRGALSDDADQDAIRDVVAGVEGVREVELDLGTAG